MNKERKLCVKRTPHCTVLYRGMVSISTRAHVSAHNRDEPKRVETSHKADTMTQDDAKSRETIDITLVYQSEPVGR